MGSITQTLSPEKQYADYDGDGNCRTCGEEGQNCACAWDVRQWHTCPREDCGIQHLGDGLAPALHWMEYHLPDTPERTAEFLELGMFPPEHPDAIIERESRAARQAKQYVVLPKTVCTIPTKDPIEENDFGSTTYTESRVPLDLKCPNFGRKFKTSRCVGGSLSRSPLPCGECENCMEVWRFRKLERYGQGIRHHREQTLIIVDGLADDTEASEARAYLAKRMKGVDKFGMVCRNPDTYLWRAVVVSAEPAQRGADYAAYLKQDSHWKFTIETRPVPASHLHKYLPTNKLTEGGCKPTSFSRSWIKPFTGEVSYQFADGEIDTIQEGQKPIRIIKHNCERCDAIAKKHGDHLEHANAAYAAEWLKGITLDREAMIDLANGVEGAYRRAVPWGYEGPRRLILDTAENIQLTEDGWALRPTAKMAHLVAWLHTWEVKPELVEAGRA